ncbi:VanZ family protein [Aquisalinus flavus]|uniref:VanZ-like domain-containing protein n=1 Tax=Aquisalinus flavus TaxID=1526572 RepID=A0A8J2Y3R4_9PROT|nr:VanZ family protein [Aquisalinus flavus]MBD0426346.1 VanZ family protein [Aquisalinus flavus]UNE48088.1 VanZ family protein [Aquisalinus flavus]GGD08719.1 hypothetical protein GCM10011342_16910 [Aquisalinus flavus]
MIDFARARWFVLSMRVCFALLLVVVTLLSLIPNPDDVPGGPDFSRWLSGLLFGTEDYADKMSHFIAYGALGGTAVLAALRPFGRVVLLPVLLIAYSGLIEVLQGIGGARQADIADMLANAAGVTAGMLVVGLTLALNDRFGRKTVRR